MVTIGSRPSYKRDEFCSYATENRRVPLKISYTRLRIDRVPTCHPQYQLNAPTMSQPWPGVASDS
jgi:hypothetical protein